MNACASQTPLTCRNPAIGLSEHDPAPSMLEDEEDTWDYDRHHWLRKKSDLCTYNWYVCF